MNLMVGRPLRKGGKIKKTCIPAVPSALPFTPTFQRRKKEEKEERRRNRGIRSKRKGGKTECNPLRFLSL